MSQSNVSYWARRLLNCYFGWKTSSDPDVRFQPLGMKVQQYNYNFDSKWEPALNCMLEGYKNCCFSASNMYYETCRLWIMFVRKIWLVHEDSHPQLGPMLWSNAPMLRSMLWCCGRMLQCFGRILRCFEFAAENSLASLTLLKFYSVQSACHPRCNFLVIVVFSSADWREWGRQKCFGIYLRLNCASKWSRNILKL